MHLRRLLLLGLLALLAVYSQVETPAPAPAPSPGLLPAVSGAGLTFRLREVDAPPVEEPADAEGTPLAPDEVERILALLPEPEASRAPRDEAVLRPSERVPPARHEVLAAFPPARPASRPRPTATPTPAPLEVRRHAPDGRVAEAGSVQVTFSQDVPPSTDADVRLTPAVPGEWRWVDPRTLRFTPKDRRLPMATAYEVVVPAGLRAASGGVLEREVRWRFRTPPPSVSWVYPLHESVGPEPTVFLAFDQRVDPAVILGLVRLRRGATEIPVVPAPPPKGIPSDKLRAGTWVAFRSVRPLALDSGFEVGLPKGTPSVEGSLRTAGPWTWGFRTYAPLRRTGQSFDEQEWTAGFNNRLRTRHPAVRVDPPVAGMKVRVEGRTLAVAGKWRPDTRYRVVLPGDLTDEWGQALGRPSVATVRTPPRAQALWMESDVALLEPGRPEILVHTQAISDFRVRLYRGGTLVSERRRSVDASAEQAHTAVDLRPALRDGVGQILVEAEGAGRRARCLVQVTGIGLTAVASPEKMVVWATSMRDGTPLPGVEVRVGAETRRTSAEGLVEFPRQGERFRVLARKERDEAFLETGWWPEKPQPHLAWQVFDDRGLYRPGEKVQVKGWLRRITRGPRGGVERAAVAEVGYQVKDGMGRVVVGKGKVPVTRAGGFSVEVTLPPSVEPGTVYLELTAPKGSFEHEIRVEEFRRPEFEVSMDTAAAPTVLREEGTLSVSASYLAGGTLKNAPVHWTVKAYGDEFAPPGREDYTFGGDMGERGSQELDARTDAAGVSRVAVETLGLQEPQTVRLVAEAVVRDENQQEWTANGDWVLHPARCFVGLRSEDPLRWDVVVCDAEGKAVPDRPVRLRLLERIGDPEREWSRRDGKELWAREVRPGVVDLPPSSLKPGEYVLVAEVKDDQGRLNRTRAVFPVGEPAGAEEKPRLELLPDRESYEPGQVASLQVKSPFPEGHGLLTLHREGLLERRVFRVSGGEATLEIPLPEAVFPGVWAQVHLVGRQPASGKVAARPTGAEARTFLRVSGEAWKLAVKVASQPEVARPGEETEIAVDVTGADGRPLADAEVAVVVVDEAVLALTGYEVPEPEFASGRRPLEESGSNRAWLPYVSSGSERWEILGGRMGDATYGDDIDAGAAFPQIQMPEITINGRPVDGGQGFSPYWGAGTLPVSGGYSHTDSRPIPGWNAGFLGQQSTSLYGRKPLTLRTDFAPSALFAPALRTDASGRVMVRLKLPGSLTRYRITAVATDGLVRFGKGEASVTARKPLMLRPSPPRFLNVSDRALLPVLVQNLGDEPLHVRLAVRAENASLPEGAGRRLTVPAGERRRVSFPVTTDRPGRASFQFAALAEEDEDAAEVGLPVLTPAVAETSAAYGTLDGTTVAGIPLHLPSDIYPRFGGLEVTTSSTALQDLTDAAVYLQEYPYECSEQIASRLMATLALRDVLKDFGLAPSADAVKAAVARDVKRLAARQNPDGGFGFWGGDESWPALSLHVAQALKMAGGDRHVLAMARAYVRSCDTSGYGVDARRTLEARELAVGDADPAAARRLLREGALSPEALGWLLQALGPKAPEKGEILRRLHNAATETASSAHFATGTGGQDYLLLESDWRTDAVVLQGLLAAQPESDLIPKLVRGLLEGRVDGRWSNTQDNAYALLALNRYFRIAEGRRPDFRAGLWLGQAFVGEHSYRGRTARQDRVEVPLGAVPSGASELLVDKAGPGRLYYRVGMRWAPRSLELPAADRGFVVERTYEGIDDPADVRRNADGGWRIRAGARVRVRLRLVNREVRHHVALVDRLPAGLEAQNPELRGQRADHKAEAQWWHDHEVYRDDRVEVFASSLPAGEHRYSYVARATTQGQFLAPPAGAEEMYRPETSGRSATERVTVD